MKSYFEVSIGLKTAFSRGVPTTAMIKNGPATLAVNFMLAPSPQVLRAAEKI